MNKLAVLAVFLLWYCVPGFAEDLEGQVDKQCVPEAQWTDRTGTVIEPRKILPTLARVKVVLIGEDHENPEHHRMQLFTMAELYALQTHMAAGFEAFPRKTQNLLDQWVAGEIPEKDFIKKVKWDEIWRFNKDNYLPMFHFARMNRIPMVALNVDRQFVAEVSNKGWKNVVESHREGIGKPKVASQEYKEVLAEVFAQHIPKHAHNGEKPPELTEDDIQEILDNPSFKRFMQGQLVWDRAMAEAIVKALQRDDVSLVVGIMGAGHVMGGYGVVHQLEDLGMARQDIKTLMPWDGSVDCEELKNGAFDYAFGVKYFPPGQAAEPAHPRLGVYLEHDDGVTVTRLVPDSVAEKMGMKVGDKIVEVAGKPVEKVMDVVEAVKATPFGRWLPLVILRDGKKQEMLARFPPGPDS